MKINKIILSGIILILFAGLLIITDVITPFIRPLTYLFLMGSSKGKDILFFGLFGLFLIISQSKKYKSNKFLLIVILTASVIFTISMVLEIYLRLRLGISLNTIFVTIKPSFSTTSILHTHLIKSILGEFLINIIPVGHDINTAFSLYHYIDLFSIPIIILTIILFISIILSLPKKEPSIAILLSFFSSILFIGCFDGGIMGTPGALGLFGCIFVYWDEYYILRFFKIFSKKNPISYKEFMPNYLKKPHTQLNFYLNRGVPYFIGLFIILLRLSISIYGASPDYYEVDIFNPVEDVNLTDEYPIEYIAVDDNKITYHISSSLNEHNLTNSLKNSLNNSCDYYTISWNFYSYF